ncbi:MAG: hypothetical protein WAV56_02670 [Microgenomates group bacterium]
MYLTFSDSAKFAQAGLNLLTGRGLVISHSFFDPKILSSLQPGDFFPANFLPFTLWILSLFFRFLPVSDQTIALVGWIAFLASALLIFLITNKLHRLTSALVATILFIFNMPFWEYATNASSEIFFTFQILLLVFLYLSRFPWLFLLPLVLMFFTRQQATVVLLSCVLTGTVWFLTSKRTHRFKIITLLIISVVFFTMIKLSLVTTQFRFSPASVIGSLNLPANTAQGLFLRGLTYTPITAKQLIVKIFYNVYNFAKNPAQLVSPVILAFFLLGLFIRKVDKTIGQFNFFALVTFILFILAASATLPNARYIHPVIPLIIISGSMAVVHLIHQSKIVRKKVALMVIVFLVISPLLGHLTIDARFRRQQFNTDQPTAYRQISRVMAESIPKGKLIITNLDAWAAWYEGLTTMWFPLSPDLLEGYQDKVGYIVITNYKEQDGDFALGEWREVVYSPDLIRNKFLKTNFRVLKTFIISPDQVYENQAYQGTILVRR